MTRLAPAVLPGVEIEQFPWQGTRTIRFHDASTWTCESILVEDDRALAEMSYQAKQSEIVAYDTEGSGLVVALGARICGHVVAIPTGARSVRAWYVPVRHVGEFNESAIQIDPVLAAEHVRTVLTARGLVVGHHLKHDVSQAEADGIYITRERHDTCTSALLANENEPRFGLKPLMDKHLFADASGDADECDTWRKKDAKRLRMPYKKLSPQARAIDPLQETYLERFGYSRTPVKLLGQYACMDGFGTLGLFAQHSSVRARYPETYAREMGVAYYLQRMEYDGLTVDRDEIESARVLCLDEIAHWRDYVNRTLGTTDFDVGNANAIRELLYTKYKLPVVVRTDEGEAAVDKKAFKLLKARHPDFGHLLDAIQKYNRATKLYGTYVIPWIKYTAPDGTIHSSYNQLEQRDKGGVPVTGRLSSANPNAQNTGGRAIHMHACRCKDCLKELGLKDIEPGKKVTMAVRRFYVVRPGYIRIYIDFSQIELRVLTWYCQDSLLLECYQKGIDVHQRTADMVTAGDRKAGKTTNFAVVYGTGPGTLAAQLVYFAEETDRALRDAKVYLDRFFEVYAGVAPWKDQLASDVRRSRGHFISPYFRRPRTIPTLYAQDRELRSRAERMLVSTAVQGFAADLMKETMLRCGHYLAQHAPGSFMKQTIHDELAFDLPLQPGWVSHVRNLKRCFEDWPIMERGGVPVVADVDVSTTTWEAKREMKFLPDGTVELEAA